jgi:hypothetical protein
MTLFLFFDESGNLDFSNTGTRFYTFGCLGTKQPSALLHPLADLRYELLAEGVELESFHASEDRQVVRDKVFRILQTAEGFEFDSIIIDKRKVPPGLYPIEKFYPFFAGYLLNEVLKRYTDAEKIVLVTDRIPLARKREAVSKGFKQYIRAALGDRPFTLVHQNTAAHMCLQAADYFMWAVYKKWSSEERRPYVAVERMIRSETRIYSDAERDNLY